ncbi:MAG: hotdog fold domain-containing protein, partial [Pseudomonadota bacterium]
PEVSHGDDGDQYTRRPGTESPQHVMANWLYLQSITAYTAKASIRYRHHARVGETLSLVGECIDRRRRRVTLRGVATEDSTGTVICETEGVFMVDPAGGS